MNQAHFHFFTELNDFLTNDRRNIAFSYDFKGNPAIKHLIEALGVPHPEVGQILVNFYPVELSYRVQNGDYIEIHPFVGTDHGLSEIEPRFVLDNHLGKLAIYLRLLSFDVWYSNDYQDDELADTASREGRILLTRDRRLLMRRVVVHGHCVRSRDPETQVVEIIQHYHLYNQINPFKRCLCCNHPLELARKEIIKDRLQLLTNLYYDEFHICPGCNRVYWKGSHYDNMQGFIERILLSSREKISIGK